MKRLVALGLGVALAVASPAHAKSDGWTVLEDGSAVRMHADPFDGRLITLHQSGTTATLSIDEDGDGVAEFEVVTETSEPDSLLYEYLGLLGEQDSGVRPSIRDLIGKLTLKDLGGPLGHGGGGLPQHIRDQIRPKGWGPAGHGDGWNGNTPYELEQTDDNRWSKGFDNGDQHDHVHVPGGSQEDHIYFEEDEIVVGELPGSDGAPPEPEENPGEGSDDGNGPRKIGIGPYGGVPDLASLLAAARLVEIRERFLREHTTLWVREWAPINPKDRGGRGGDPEDPAGTTPSDSDEPDGGGEPNYLRMSLDPWINPGWTIERIGRR